MHEFVDPHRAGFELFGDFDRRIGVLRPDRARQTVFGRIGARDRFIHGRKLHQRHDRAELFLGDDPRVFRRIVEDGDRHVIAGARRIGVSARQEVVAIILGILNQFADPLELFPVLDRPDSGALLRSVTHSHALGIVRNGLRQIVVDVFVDVDPLGRDADLAGIGKARPEQLLGHLLDIGIGEDDRGVVAAQFQRDALQIARRAFHDLLPRRGRSGEGDLVDAGMLGDERAEAVFAGDDVDRALGHHILDQFGDAQSRQRREGRRFEHDGAARHQSGHDLLNRHHDREIPRHDPADHAHRHAAGARQTRIVVLIDDIVQRQARLRLGKSRRAVNLLLRLRMRLALLAGEQAEQFVRIVLDRRRDAQNDFLALFRRRLAPALESGARRIDRAVELILSAGGNLGDDLFRRRVEHVDRRFARHHLAVDQIGVGLGHISLLSGRSFRKIRAFEAWMPARVRSLAQRASRG